MDDFTVSNCELIFALETAHKHVRETSSQEACHKAWQQHLEALLKEQQRRAELR